MSEMVDKINPDDTGIYLVTTQGSIHLWNMDERWYQRNPGKHVTLDEMKRGFLSEFNEGKNSISGTRWWPEVDGMFLVDLWSPQNFHRSSQIKTIERLSIEEAAEYGV